MTGYGGSMARVVDNPSASQYEVFADDGALAGYSTYERQGDHIVFLHTEIDLDHEGQGLGSILVRTALEDVRDRGLKVVPRCPFVKEYLERHLEYDGLRA